MVSWKGKFTTHTWTLVCVSLFQYRSQGQCVLGNEMLQKYVFSNSSKHWFKYVEALPNLILQKHFYLTERFNYKPAPELLTTFVKFSAEVAGTFNHFWKTKGHGVGKQKPKASIALPKGRSTFTVIFTFKKGLKIFSSFDYFGHVYFPEINSNASRENELEQCQCLWVCKGSNLPGIQMFCKNSNTHRHTEFSGRLHL